tara:strand:- start:443 stop:637 length:195 start_codon:yes stop_codon:yes gene_type:complete
MGKNMSALQPSNLSNRELILACDNAWTMAGLPTDLQFELYTRFCRLAPIDEHPAQDDKQLDLFL